MDCHGIAYVRLIDDYFLRRFLDDDVHIVPIICDSVLFESVNEIEQQIYAIRLPMRSMKTEIIIQDFNDWVV